MTDQSAHTDLFSPARLGALDLANRIVMAPLTRSRANDDGVVGVLQATHYAQRASAGLIVAEATNISPQARGYARTPGIWTDEQVEGWRLVTDADRASQARPIMGSHDDRLNEVPRAASRRSIGSSCRIWTFAPLGRNGDTWSKVVGAGQRSFGTRSEA